MTEIIERDPVYELIPKEDFEFLVKFDEQEKRYKLIKEKIKALGKEFLEKNQTDSYKQSLDGVNINIVAVKPCKRKQIDVQALKDQGLYESFLKEIEVEGSIKITIDYDD